MTKKNLVVCKVVIWKQQDVGGQITIERTTKVSTRGRTEGSSRVRSGELLVWEERLLFCRVAGLDLLSSLSSASRVPLTRNRNMFPGRRKGHKCGWQKGNLCRWPSSEPLIGCRPGRARRLNGVYYYFVVGRCRPVQMSLYTVTSFFLTKYFFSHGTVLLLLELFTFSCLRLLFCGVIKFCIDL